MDVCENNLRTDLMNRFRGCDVGEWCCDDFIARSDIECAERQCQGIGTRVYAHAEFRFGIGGDFLLQCGNIWTEDVVAARQSFFDGRQQFGFQRLVLRLEIEKRNVHSRARIQEKGCTRGNIRNVSVAPVNRAPPLDRGAAAQGGVPCALAF